jgi:hypothetical protein
MSFSEIILTPIHTSCSCLPCTLGAFKKLREGVQDMKTGLVEFLAKPNIGELLKLGKTSADFHSRMRFAVVFSLINTPERQLVFFKSFLSNPNFDVELFDFSVIKSFLDLQKNRNYAIESWIEMYIKHAVVYHRFPEFIKTATVCINKQDFMSYAVVILEMGDDVFRNFFKAHFHVTVLLGFIEMAFEAFLLDRSNLKAQIVQELHEVIYDGFKTYENEFWRKRCIIMTNRILQEGNHDLLPYKTPNFGAKTKEEYQLIFNGIKQVQSSFSREKYYYESRIKSKLNSIAELKNEIEKIEKNMSKRELSQSRLHHLSELTHVLPIERLNMMIDSDKSIYYFPEYMFHDALDFIYLLSDAKKDSLRRKLKTAKRGILKKIKFALG